MANQLSVESLRTSETSPAKRSQFPDGAQSHGATRWFPDDEKMQSRFQTLMKSQHWLGAYIANLVSAYDRSGDVDFSAAEQLLSAEKQQFETDLAVARRMLRLYGEQLPE